MKGWKKELKQFKTLVALVLALMLMVSVASAATIVVETGSTAGDNSESQDVLNGETYNAYKILNYTTDGDKAFSYYLTAAQYASSNSNGLGALLESVGFHFTASSDGTLYYVDNTDEITNAATVASGLYAIKDKIAAVAIESASATATADKQAVFSNLDIGYWFVTSSLGALTSLQSYTAENIIVEKNSTPTIDKTEKTSGENYVDGPVDANIGDTIYYQIVVTDGVGTNAELKVTDTMSAGLTYNAGTLKINDTAVADDADVTDKYKVTVSGQTITIVFAPAYVAGLGTGDTITITFNATINENAVIDSATGNENKVELDYSNQHSEDKVYVETYDFQLYKTDGTSFLDGAGFKLYDAATDGNQITVGKDNTGYYVDANSDVEILVDSANGVNVRGLAPGTYYLEETTVPGGYNKLAAREAVTITTGATAAVEVTVENNAGSELPSTGGIGTTIFYIAGAVLVLGAAAIVIARRKADQH